MRAILIGTALLLSGCAIMPQQKPAMKLAAARPAPTAHAANANGLTPADDCAHGLNIGCHDYQIDHVVVLLPAGANAP